MLAATAWLAARDAKAVRVRLLLVLVAGLLLVAAGRLIWPLRVQAELPAFFEGRYPILSVCLVAACVVQLLTLQAPARRTLLVLITLVELPNLFPILPLTWPAPLGLGGALVATGLRVSLAYRAVGPLRAEHLGAAFDALVPAWFFVVSVSLLGLASEVSSSVRDLDIQAIGGVLGGWPPILVAQLFARLPALGVLCTANYLLMPLELAVVHALAWRRHPSQAPRLLAAFVLIPLVGFPLYLLLPMVGPREAWHCLNAAASFPPLTPPDITAHPTLHPELSIPRNCMPSLHTAWTLAAVFEGRRVSRSVFVVTLIWFAGTELATLGLGEHWLVDLVVAVPFTCAVYGVAGGALRTSAQRRAVVILTLLVLTWILALREFSATLAAQPVGVAIAMLFTPVFALWIAAPVQLLRLPAPHPG
jgi:PAP2 superfamily